MNSSIAIILFDWLIFIREISSRMSYAQKKKPIVLFFYYKHDFQEYNTIEVCLFLNTKHMSFSLRVYIYKVGLNKEDNSFLFISKRFMIFSINTLMLVLGPGEDRTPWKTSRPTSSGRRTTRRRSRTGCVKTLEQRVKTFFTSKSTILTIYMYMHIY